MAAVNSFRIDIKGKQSHGSRPWNSVDPNSDHRLSDGEQSSNHC